MKGFVVLLTLAWGIVAPVRAADLEPMPPGEPVTMEPVLGDGTAIATPSDTFTITNTSELRANVNVEKAMVLVLPAAGQGFVMHLQFRNDAIENGELVSEKQMKDAITRLAEPFVQDAQDAKPPFKSLKYGGRQGWYAVFTDKRLVGVDQPPVNDYRCAVVGLLRVSEGSVLQFTLMVNDLASPEFFGPLGYAMKFAKPMPTTEPAGK